jgi:flavorubredoxin
VRDFHGYTTKRGATYNAYFVNDEKPTLIDTVKGPYAQVLLDNIAAITEPESVAYVVCNHAEPDHSSGFPAVMKALPNATVVCNEKCRTALGKHYDTSQWKFHVVASGDTLSVGKRTLTFIDTPMVHWPESMFTYVPEEALLFSMDAFGQHYSSSQRFDDENPLCTVMEEARIYYANIVTPYSRRVKQTLAAAAGLDIGMIAPSHGIVWRSHIDEILKAYGNWSECRSKNKVVVLYDTMWQSTARMARAIVNGAADAGAEVKLLSIRDSDLTTIATEMLDCACVAAGSSTLNRDMLPMVAAALSYIKGLTFTNRAAVAFGSYGWGKGGPEAIHEKLSELKWTVLREPIKANFKPDDDCLAECTQAGRQLAETAAEMAAASEYQPLCTD